MEELSPAPLNAPSRQGASSAPPPGPSGPPGKLRTFGVALPQRGWDCPQGVGRAAPPPEASSGAAGSKSPCSLLLFRETDALSSRKTSVVRTEQH